MWAVNERHGKKEPIASEAAAEADADRRLGTSSKAAPGGTQGGTTQRGADALGSSGARHLCLVSPSGTRAKPSCKGGLTRLQARPRPPATFHFHGARGDRLEVPAPRGHVPLRRRGVGSRGPARSRVHPDLPKPASPAPTRESFCERTPGEARSQAGHRVRAGATASRTDLHTHRLPPGPSLTCLHRVREVVAGGRGPGKFLQFPGTEVQAPGVDRLLQRALQTPVQGQVEAPAAAAAASPAASPGAPVVLVVVMVVVVVRVMMRVQASRREGRDERLGFACRRRHLRPRPPTPPRRSCGGGRSFSPRQPLPSP